MLAGGDDHERIRQKSARLNNWQKSGLFAALGCGAANPGVGRGGALEFPADAKAFAALFDELTEGGATFTEIAMLIATAIKPHQLNGTIGQAIRGELDLALVWRPVKAGPGFGDWLLAAQPAVVSLPASFPNWESGRWINLTRAFARVRQ